MKPFCLSLLALPFLFSAVSAEETQPTAPPVPATPLTPAAPVTAAPVKHVEAAEAAKELDAAAKDPAKAITVLDVRTPEEFAGGHLKGAKNLDFNESGFQKQLAGLDRSKTYLVHCAAGGRSTRSLKVFEKLGFKSVIHLDGGYDGWKKAGLPVEK